MGRAAKITQTLCITHITALYITTQSNLVIVFFLFAYYEYNLFVVLHFAVGTYTLFEI